MNTISILIICLAVIALGVVSCTIIISLRYRNLISNNRTETLWFIFLAIYSIPILVCVFK